MNWYLINGLFWVSQTVYWFISARFTARTKSSEGWLLYLSHLIPLAIGFWLIFHSRNWFLFYGVLYDSLAVRIAGTIITAAGLLFTVWARIYLGKYWSGIITLKEGHKLIRSGPYRLVRHPIYTGYCLAALGSAIAFASGDAFIGFVVITATCLGKIRREEKLLTAAFGDEYRQFQAEVTMLVPFVF
jgi:protein-S-isoprenylcysteine O-methyltransferase Ste14